MKGQDYNFNKLTADEVDSLGQAYDYDSIMHYARNTFSKGTYLDTILPVEMKGRKRPEIGQRLRLSSGDIAQANLLYKCPKCGRTFQDNTGQLHSPSYNTGGALTNETEHCEWRITATHGERVVLRVENLVNTEFDKFWRKLVCKTDLSIIVSFFFCWIRTFLNLTIAKRTIWKYVMATITSHLWLVVFVAKFLVKNSLRSAAECCSPMWIHIARNCTEDLWPNLRVSSFKCMYLYCPEIELCPKINTLCK